jgi:hypothetical protein
VLNRIFHRKSTCGQSMVEFVILLPLMGFFLLAVVKISIIAINSQRLDMAAYYASRLYSKSSIKGIKKGTPNQLLDRRRDIIDKYVLSHVRAYLKTNDVSIDYDGYNKVSLTWPIEVRFGIGNFYFSKRVVLKSAVEMENEPLSYAGGRTYE